MAAGGKGDHPLTDHRVYRLNNLPAEIAELVDQIDAIDPTALNDRWEDGMFAQGNWKRCIELNGDWFAWERGEKLDEAREFLLKRLDEAKSKKT